MFGPSMVGDPVSYGGLRAVGERKRLRSLEEESAALVLLIVGCIRVRLAICSQVILPPSDLRSRGNHGKGSLPRC